MTNFWWNNAQRLVDTLEADGYLADPHWRQAFIETPRHLFLPAFFHPLPDGRWRAADTGSPDYWESVYSDTTLTTQLNGAITPTPNTEPLAGEATSSSTQPSLMAAMLDALSLAGSERVLEIGTGTGYNAALLSHRLGADKVTSVEVDPTVSAVARQRLNLAGHQPTTVVGDGQQGWGSGAPYDRLIATVSVPGVPAAWLSQVRDGGVIVVSLWRDLGGGPLVRLNVDDGIAQGLFLPEAGGFMPVRSVAKARQALSIAAKQTGVSRPATVPGEVLHEPEIALWIALRVPVVTWLGFTPEEGGLQTWLFAAGGSWSMLDTTAGTVEQFGSRRLWDEVEHVYSLWEKAGRPTRGRLGLTATSTGQHSFWLDDPSNIQWRHS
ncbi:ATP-grasp peptide maturase system methyltransferase [Actinoplanes couchii]|uniref:Protein-L-isoaspartate O-methyltransferase n=1 Tax=Actinoplanes couchii TaxID=403638 RepID=A0ABQ3XTQ7_9ACTN|nr:ATP-grasp peptide maturase system methyltransferase [Actinoplanes couchii]MDR6318966.1 protein-L-isoaspartate(D-aspartate) O-methyltransferase [Actinoplanes couchii]GID61815.1 protein-L-isoaspartate O-methyltransferase [Actinoplanes couchii]